MQWGNQQAEALKKVNKWYTSRDKSKPVFVINGFAGTGKTTLAKHFAESINGLVLYGAFTGKAALVMRKNGCVGARTIHSMIYKADQDPETGVITWKRNNQSPLEEAALLIVDECSMVNDEMGRDLLRYGVPIIALGDPGQLPPIQGAGFFSSMEPDVMLTEIHRQAKENPIIYLADLARNGYALEPGDYGDSKIWTKTNSEVFRNADQVIVGRNVTRVDLNTKMRKLLGYNDSPLPLPGERLICLKNDRELVIFNGETFTCIKQIEQKYKSNFTLLQIRGDDDERPDQVARIHKSFFDDEQAKPDWRILKGSQEFDYGYVISCHKSQGSQFGSPFIIDESYCFRDDRWKWIYTAITRAINKVDILVS